MRGRHCAACAADLADTPLSQRPTAAQALRHAYFTEPLPAGAGDGGGGGDGGAAGGGASGPDADSGVAQRCSSLEVGEPGWC